MDSVDWELCGKELASFAVDRASSDLANRNLASREKLSSGLRVAGFGWNKAFVRAIGDNRLSADPQRAAVNPHTKQLARASKLRLRRIWWAPPGLAVDEPHKQWDLIATAGPSGRASNEAWNRLSQEPREILICALSDLAELRADQLHFVLELEESSRLHGRLWRAVRAAGDATDFRERSDSSIYIRKGWGAFQLAAAITADSAQGAELGRSFCARAEEPRISMEEGDSIGPQAKLRRVAEGSSSVEQINQFAQSRGSAKPAEVLLREPSLRSFRHAPSGSLLRLRLPTTLPSDRAGGSDLAELFRSW